MKRRRLIALVSICTLFALGLLAVAAVVVVMRTDLARNFAQGWLERRVNGTVYVGRISGNPFSGITIDTIAIRDAKGELVLSSGRFAADYDIRDVMDSRLFLRHVIADHPYVHLRQFANGDWNYRRLVKRSPSPVAKQLRAPSRTLLDFVVLDSVRALNGTFILSLSWTPDDTLRGRARDSVINRELARTDRKVEKTADGYARTFTWSHGTALLPHVRVVDPDSNKFGQTFHIASLDADESDPPFQFRKVRGVVRHLADSLWIDLKHWDLPASAGSATGKMVWGGPLPIRYDLTIPADSVALNDVNWVYPTLPKTGGGKLVLYISNKRDVHVMDYRLAKMDMRSDGSHLTGEMTFGVGAPILQVLNVNLIANPLDFQFIHTLNGKPLPIDWRGQIYGNVRASGGPLTDFEVDAAHGEWRDAHVPGAVSRFSGSGGLDILNPLFTAFHDFHLDVGSLDLRSIEYLFPAFPRLGGTISGQATLDAIWTDVRFRDADIMHRDGPGKPSRFLGSGRVTDGKQYITYDVALNADSISFETLARSYPSLKLRGMAAGPITIRGQTPNLQVTTRLSGPAGQLAYNGTLDLDSLGGYSARGRGEFARLNLSRLLTNPRAPLSSLNGRYDLDVRGSSGRTLSGLAALKVDRSKLDSAMVDSANATIRFINGRAILTDTVHAQGSMGRLKAYGSIGLPGGETIDSIHVTLTVDSVGSLRPYFATSRGSTRPDSLGGKLLINGVAVGNLDSLLVTGTIAGENLYVRGIDAPRLAGTFSIFDALRAPHGVIDATASDMLVGGLEFDTVRAHVTIADTAHGSYTVAGVGSIIPNLALAAGGSWAATGPATAVRLDSLSLAMADSRWVLEQPATLSIDASMFSIDTLAFRNGKGGAIGIAGVVPDSGPVNLRLLATHVPLADLDRLIAPFPAPIAGFANFTALFGGTQQDLRVDATATLDSIMIGDVRIGRLVSSALYQNQRATIALDISQDTKQVLAARADSLPLSVTLFGYETLPGRVHATLSADSADFALVQALLAGVTGVTGKMSGHVSLDGSWSQPEVSGQFALRDASLHVDTLGIVLDSLSGSATFARDTLTIAGLRARSGDARNSLADVSGWIAFQKWIPSWFDVKLNMRDFEAYNRSELARVVATTDSGPVRLFGSTSADSLTGFITVKRGNIFLPDPKIAAKQIRDQLNPPPDTGTIRRAASDTITLFQRITKNLSTDLRVHLGSDVSLSADYADIPLTGDLRITQSTVYSATAARGAGAYISRLAPEGTVFADRGTYTLDFGGLFRRDLRVDRGGTITFDRTADWNPDLNLTTRYNVKSYGHPDIPVIVDVKGRLLPSPRLAFRTDAPFPISESDLLSYLLTGQPGFDLAGQSTEYKSLVASVLAPTLSSAISSQLRGKLSGLDLRLESASADIAGATGAVAIGKSVEQFVYSTRINGEMQVSDNLFVTLTAGLCQLNNGYRASLAQGSVLNQLSDPFGGNLQYRLRSTVRTGSNLQLAVEPSTQALLCSPSSELSLRGAAPTPRQYSLSFLKYWRW